jgi:hypothetical protein
MYIPVNLFVMAEFPVACREKNIGYPWCYNNMDEGVGNERTDHFVNAVDLSVWFFTAILEAKEERKWQIEHTVKAV